MSIKRKLRHERDEARIERDDLWVWLDDVVAWAEDTVADYPRLEQAKEVRDRLAGVCEERLRARFVVYDEPVR